MRLSVPGYLNVGKLKFLFTEFVLVLVLFFAFSLLIKPAVFAQTQTNANTQPQNVVFSSNNPDVSQDINSYTQNIMLSFIGGAGCQLAGYNPVTGDQTCLGFDKSTGKFGYVNNQRGAIGFLSNMIATLYTPPIHTADYFSYLAGNFGIAKGAYAQAAYGVGLTSIHPLSGLFITFRNISYFIFVIIFVFIGMGIMLRLRIDPRTVMTIQNQIPKVIIGIILITLSFAISGLMIDLMWVLIIALVNTLVGAHPSLSQAMGGSPGLYNTPFSLSGVLGGFLGIATNTAGTIGNTMKSIFNPESVAGAIQIPSGSASSCGFIDPVCWIGDTIQNAAAAVVGWLVGWVVGILAWFVIIIAVIVSLFRLWFALLKAYIMAIFDIIFAPFWIVAGLLPGAGPNVGFTAWLRELASNLMPFPAVIGLFLIARIIADGLTTVTTNNFFFPPLIGGGGEGINMGAIISFGIIMASPNIVNMVKTALKASGPGGGLGSTNVGIAALGVVGGGIKRRAYWRDSQGNTRGFGAELGRSAGRRISNSGVAKRMGSATNRGPIGSLKRNWGYGTSHELQTASDAERASIIDPAKAKGKTAREIESELHESRESTSQTKLAKAIAREGGQGGQGGQGGAGGAGSQGPQGPQGPVGPAGPTAPPSAPPASGGPGTSTP